MFRLCVSNLAKQFGSRRVFSGISFELSTGDSIAVVGPNGSGKTTLLMTLLARLRPTDGQVDYFDSDLRLGFDQVRDRTSLVAPYLSLYDNLTAEENLKFFATVAGVPITGRESDALLKKVGLERRGMDLVREYSSGMIQRLKFALALLKKPAILFLDEPTSNLDDNGRRFMREMLDECRDNCILVIATNNEEEYELASGICRVGQ